MSQIFYLGPSFHVIKSRKKVLKNVKILPVFWHEIKTKAHIPLKTANENYTNNMKCTCLTRDFCIWNPTQPIFH